MKGGGSISADRIGGLFLFVVGLASLYGASRLTFGDVREPGPGFYPVVVSILLTAFGVLSLFDPNPTTLEGQTALAGNDGRVWMVVLGLALYILALPRVGFILCTVALLLLLLRGVCKLSWVGSATSAVIASAACYAVFRKLGLALPAGLLPF